MAILNNNPLIGSGGNQGYNINNSLRFRSSASAYLNRTPASAGNRKTWTYSAWIKRGALPGSELDFFSASPSVDGAIIRFNSDNTLRGYDYSGSFSFNFVTTQVFRDPSAWYHIVVAYDSTQATSGNRFKVYVNGNQVTAFSSTTYPSLNQDTYWFNNTNVHNIGRNSFTGVSYFDGYLADVNFIDGSAKTPSDFGETDTTTGVWKPKAYTGTYGTNGFYLKFSDIATTSGSNAGLGKDFSGNGNYWTTNNISVTSGTTYDAMTDSPTLTSATVANYAVLNPLSYVGSPTFSNANLTESGTLDRLVKATIGITSGKWYWECIQTAGSNSMFGLATIDSTNSFCGGGTTSWGYYGGAGTKWNNNSGSAYGSSFTTNDVIGVAFDADAGTLTFYKNNVSQGTAFTGLTGNTYTPAGGNGSNTNAFNFGQRPFAYTPPTGYVALNTYNLPTPTILQGNKYMDATLYTGTGSSLNVTGVNFQPDFVWIKERVGAADHGLYDAVRGVQKQLESNTTSAETTETTGLTAFNSNGFTVGALAQLNTNTDTYVGWSWKANGAGSSNTSGTITSTVSVNTTAGFSIVTYTGNGVGGATVGHGLGVAPKFIIAKTRNNVDNWPVGTSALGWNQHLLLNLTNATAVTSSTWSDTAPTSTVFTIGTDSRINANTWTYVAYCWAEIAGFSRFGSYTGNGSADGPFVYTGFRPKFVLWKRTTLESWIMMDTSRSPFNVADKILYPFSNAAEITSNRIDIVSNGFKIRTTDGDTNASGGTYIYMAFAENPFKNALAR